MSVINSADEWAIDSRPSASGTTTKQSLYPCPFCGSKASRVMDNAESSSGRRYFITCDNRKCLAEGPVAQTVQRAWEKWNLRTEAKKNERERRTR